MPTPFLRKNIFFLYILCSLYSYGQNTTDKEESKINYISTFLDRFEKLHNNVKKAQAQDDVRLLFVAYRSLMIYYGELKQIDSVDYYAKQVQQLSNQKGITPNFRSRFHTDKGTVMYYFFEDFNAAIKEYGLSHTILKREVPNPGPNQLIDLEMKIASCYSSLNQLDKALEFMNPARDLSKVNKGFQYQYYDFLGTMYLQQKMPFKAEEAHKKALSLAEDDTQRYLIYSKIPHELFLKKDYKKAIQKGLRYRKLFEKHFEIELKANSIILASSFYEIGDYKNSIFYAKDALSRLDKYEVTNILTSYEILQNNYTMTKQHDSLIKYSNLNKKINDSLYLASQKELVDLHLENGSQNNISKEKVSVKANISDKVSYVVLAGASLVFFILFIVWYRKRKEKLLAASNTKEANSGEETKDVDTLNEKTALLSQTVHKVEDIEKPKNNEVPPKEAIVTEAVEFTISPENEEYYDNLFLQRLEKKHPELSKTELKHCLYMKKAFSLKEVSELLNISVATVKSGRYRAKSKLDLKSEQSPKQYLKNIYFQTHNKGITFSLDGF